MRPANCIVLFFLAVAFLPNGLMAQEVPVFVSGSEGYRSFRIPAIIRLPGNDLLAFCEGRKNNAADFGDIDIVMKRSADKGKSWSPLQVIADLASLQAGNPAPVLDLLDPAYPEGRIFLFYNTGNDHESNIVKGIGIRECRYITSGDGGKSWSAPVNITVQVHRPKQPAVDPAYNFKDDWRAYANTPGHALQITEGRFRGRIYIASNHSSGEPQKGGLHYFAHGYFSDDHGKTFRLSETVNWPGSNESTAAELSNGMLLMNSRNQGGTPKARIISLSHDGGATWDTTFADPRLPDPVCEGSLINIGKRKGRQVLAFCNPADTANRDNLTLRISFDEGRNWQKSVLISRKTAAGNGDHAAYSDLVITGKRKIGVLYEKNNYREIFFSVVKW